MIQATELRLSNYVKYNGTIMSVIAIESPKPRKEKRFDGKYTVELFDGTGFITATTDQVDGIELTEELLLGSGFERTVTDMSFGIKYIDYRRGQFVLFLLPTGFVEVEFCAIHNTIEERGYINKVKFLHELQNLKQCLTQKELQINLHNQK